MGWALIIIAIVVIVVAYVVIQETRAQEHWRGLVRRGDVNAVRTLVEQQIVDWRKERPPATMPPSVWHGVEGAELVEITRDAVRVSTSVEGQFAVVDGRRREVSTVLEQAMAVTAALAERLLYDIPNVRLERVQVDVYTTFRREQGPGEQRCVLSTVADRETAAEVDWGEEPPQAIVRRFGGRCALDAQGEAQPVDPAALAPEAEAGSKAEGVG